MNTQNQLTIKLFAGFSLTSELRMHLKASKTWSQTQIQPELQPLIETHHEHHNYLGQFITNIPITLDEMHTLEQKLKQLVLSHCPGYPEDKLQLITFSQVFIP